MNQEDRTKYLGDVARLLRVVVYEPLDRIPLDELTALYGRSMPTAARDFDVGGWVSWCVAGMLLFANEFPTMREASAESRRVVMALAMLRTRGSISAAARLLGTSRKALRDGLQRMGLYPWPRVGADDEGDPQ